MLGITVPDGVAAKDADDCDEVPAELLAVLLNVYAVPLVNPGTVHEVAGTITVQFLSGVIAVVPALLKAVTVYELGESPVVGATMATVALASPATTVGVPGVPGVLKLVTSQFPMLLLSAAAPNAFTGLTEK
jgi:hypothetical protein